MDASPPLWRAPRWRSKKGGFGVMVSMPLRGPCEILTTIALFFFSDAPLTRAQKHATRCDNHGS